LRAYSTNPVKKLHKNNGISLASHRFEAKTGKKPKTISYNATASCFCGYL